MNEYPDMNTKSLQEAVIALTAKLETAEKREKELVGLLEIAQCPCCDGSGAYYDGMGEVCQCQWCDEKSKALTGSKPIQGDGSPKEKL